MRSRSGFPVCLLRFPYDLLSYFFILFNMALIASTCSFGTEPKPSILFTVNPIIIFCAAAGSIWLAISFLGILVCLVGGRIWRKKSQQLDQGTLFDRG